MFWVRLHKAYVVLCPHRNSLRWVCDVNPWINVELAREVPRDRDVLGRQIDRMLRWCHDEAAVEPIECVVDWPLVVDVDWGVGVGVRPVNGLC